MDILFWSGGKDSYLALKYYRRERGRDRPLKLLTTYEQERDVVPHQNIPLENIKKQAEELKLESLRVPLPENCPNETYLEAVGRALKDEEKPVERLVFGDWRLEDIREWREKEFGRLGYECFFPIWEKSLHDLLPVLILNPVEVKISAVKEEFRELIRVGETYDQRFVQTLPPEIDPMGENGEFHTEVIFRNLKDRVV
ncbi:MAG: hypothetical protein R3224_02895 [Balneolaceae bacterium]|nr:hypothetical protein [Balneolaceae bacterium]